MFALLPHVQPGGLVGLGILLFLGVLLLEYLIRVLISWMVYNAALDIPAEQREIEPALAFLLLVPFLGTFLSFLIQPAVARSHKRWFAARGVAGQGDCGESTAWWYAIASVCALVPCVPFAGLAAIVLQIVYLVRLGRVRAAARLIKPAL